MQGTIASDWPAEVMHRLARIRSLRVVERAMPLAENPALSERGRAEAVKAIATSVEPVFRGRDSGSGVHRVVLYIGAPGEPPPRDAVDFPTFMTLDLPRFREFARDLNASVPTRVFDANALRDSPLREAVDHLLHLMRDP